MKLLGEIIVIVMLKKSEAKEPFSFSFVNANDESIVKSENYAAKRSALNGIESIKKNCTDDNRYELKESKNGKFFFNIKATNGQIIGTSKLFATEEIRNSSISQLKTEACDAELFEIASSAQT